MPEVAVTDTVQDDSLVLALTGDLDVLTSPGCARRLTDAIAGRAPTCRSVLLDMRLVDFCGSAGLRLLSAFAIECAELGLRVCVVAGSRGVVHRIMEVSGLDGVLPVFDDIGTARLAMR